MNFIAEEIKRVEQRLNELKPALEEAAQLNTILVSLKRQQGGATKDGDQPSKRAYMSKEQRIRQLEDFLATHKGASNQEMAEALGVTPARISQLLPEIKKRSKGSPVRPK